MRPDVCSAPVALKCTLFLEIAENFFSFCKKETKFGVKPATTAYPRRQRDRVTLIFDLLPRHQFMPNDCLPGLLLIAQAVLFLVYGHTDTQPDKKPQMPLIGYRWRLPPAWAMAKDKKVKIKFSNTRYQALGPELIPVYRQSARR